jgi:hypothetical protein
MDNFMLVSKCEYRYSSCSELIRTKKTLNHPGQYSMEISFTQAIQNKILVAKAIVYVVIKQIKIARTAPSFMNAPCDFYISESLESGAIARNSTIYVYENDQLPPFASGFYLELYDNDLSKLNQVFELVPNYGQNLLISNLKLRENKFLDFEKGPKQYDLIVMLIFFKRNSLGFS